MKMKTNKHISAGIFALLLALIVGVSVSSCYTPSPLYGTWADYTGDSITFMTDMSYTSRVTVNGVTQSQTGTYDVLMNILVFTDDTGAIMETEWDIRGNILYLTWTVGSTNKQLTLYKIAN